MCRPCIVCYFQLVLQLSIKFIEWQSKPVKKVYPTRQTVTDLNTFLTLNTQKLFQNVCNEKRKQNDHNMYLPSLYYSVFKTSQRKFFTFPSLLNTYYRYVMNTTKNSRNETSSSARRKSQNSRWNYHVKQSKNESSIYRGYMNQKC